MVFDVLLCFILWIVYVQESISTGDIVEALRSEVIHYTFRTSLFDTVGMTGLTCCVLLTKCFLFNLPPVYIWMKWTKLEAYWEVDFPLVGTCLATLQAWDISLLKSIIVRYCAYAEVFPFPKSGSVFADDIVRLNVPTKTTREAAVDIAALLSRASLLCSELWYLYGLEVWGPDPPAFCDISVRSSNIRDYGTKVFRMEALLDAPAHKVYHDLVYNVRESPSWNKTIDCIECIQSLPSENIDIIYNVIREALGGAISRRDMVLLRTWGERDELFYVGSTSVDHPKFPPTENCVRAQQLINAWVIEPRSDDNSRSKIVWIMCNDLKLFIPQRFVESALNTELPKVLRSLQERARYLRSTADPLHPLERQFTAGTVGTSTLVVNSSNMHRTSTIPGLSGQSIGQSRQLPFI
ncbi:hypothetical protein D915_007798 [Fasciola hepatica]|uniref:START domain-containing protein n=1 Tax=Fasciola hepatica TaxID=6192 RepID=A0A4E0R4B1_FASHE|nr:hypothetical protein D915_007798 [Fasciola hepatica]